MSASNFSITRLLEKFKNLKSDAMPRPPRPAENESTEEPERPRVYVNGEEEDVEEEIIIEPEDDLKKKPRKKDRSKSKKSKDEDIYEEENPKSSKEKRGSTSSVNVQATGHVYNIVNSSGVRLGNDYYFGPVSPPQSKARNSNKYEEDVQKDNLITLLMEATIRPDHDYIDYVSKNLGENWFSFFRALGFSAGRIKTAEIDAKGYGISEARYKLLLDWVNNDDDGTLGRLATLLWKEGERSVVKELSAMYKKSKN
ncbi:death domain-containing immune deficiency protein [Anticarsia gemmatalis]|uniref:death domain-containing immune deficiency protein n=1 Tax=Anticarsia gemmatalis TaxID=129554 RepID=UPI003F770294